MELLTRKEVLIHQVPVTSERVDRSQNPDEGDQKIDQKFGEFWNVFSLAERGQRKLEEEGDEKSDGASSLQKKAVIKNFGKKSAPDSMNNF